MNKSEIGPARRLERLERVLAGRRARLALSIAGQQRRIANTGPLGKLQRHGYPAALLLVLTAVMPTVLGFALRRRRLLFGAAMNGLGMWKLRRRLDAVRQKERRG